LPLSRPRVRRQVNTRRGADTPTRGLVNGNAESLSAGQIDPFGLAAVLERRRELPGKIHTMA